MKVWSKRKRDRYLALARFFDRVAVNIRAKVKVHTPKRARRPKLVKAA